MSFISQFFNASMKSVKLIGQIDEFKGVWSLLGNTVTEHYLRLQRESAVNGIASSMRLSGISIQEPEINTLLTQTHPIFYRTTLTSSKKVNAKITDSNESLSINKELGSGEKKYPLSSKDESATPPL